MDNISIGLLNGTASIVTTYIITLVITQSNVFAPIRDFLMLIIPWNKKEHFSECRLCMSFWVAIPVMYLFEVSYAYFFLVYGLNYFMVTKES